MAASPPRTLVIDTATAACSVALLAEGRTIARLYDEVGRGHAERLLPMIAELPNGGRADAVLVDCGPGSFTGVRVGLAAARALGLGWDVPVRGYSSLPLVVAQAFARRPDIGRVAAVLEGGHGEVFAQAYDRDLLPMGDMASLKPDAAIEQLGGTPLAGSGVHRLLALRPDLDAVDLLPDAGEAWRLPPALASLPPRPLYGRAPDAKVPVIRTGAA